MSSSTVILGVDAASTQGAISASLTGSKAIDLEAGATFELRTTQEVIDEETGLVRYPDVFVVVGNMTSTSMAFGMPFNKLSPLRITPRTEQVRFFSSVGVALVWVGQIASPSCGCGGGCSSCGPVPTTKKKKACGCG